MNNELYADVDENGLTITVAMRLPIQQGRAMVMDLARRFGLIGERPKERTYIPPTGEAEERRGLMVTMRLPFSQAPPA